MVLAWLLAAALVGGTTTSGAPVVTAPAWLKKPTAQELYDAWPSAAYEKGVGGRAVISCRVDIAGLADACVVVSETPPGLGFGAAALLLSKTFLFRPETVDGQPVPGRVNVPVNFKDPPAGGRSGNSVLILGEPVFSAAPTWADLAQAYPASAHGKPLYFAFRCDVTRAGDLRDCDLKQSESPVPGGDSIARRLLAKFRIDPRQLAGKRPAPLRADVAIRLIDPHSPPFKSRQITQPQWVTIADPARALAVFPPEAIAKGFRSGLGVARCTVADDGALTACQPERSDPPGYGFDKAAVSVAGIMRMAIWTQGGGPVDGAVLDVPIRFKLAADAPAAAPSEGAPPVPPHQ